MVNKPLIYGLGIDIVQIKRIERAVKRWGDRFLKRVFTEQEMRYCLNQAAPYPSLAGRFAAKESFIKALSTSGSIRLSDIEVVRESRSGRPGIKLHGEAKRVFDQIIPGGFIHLSISHEKDYAVSIVLIENGFSSAGLTDQE